jgi:hypothetical protein
MQSPLTSAHFNPFTLQSNMAMTLRNQQDVPGGGERWWTLTAFVVDGRDQDMTEAGSIEEASLTAFLFAFIVHLVVYYKVQMLRVESQGYASHMRSIMGDKMLIGDNGGEEDIQDYVFNLTNFLFKRHTIGESDEES